VLRPALIWCDTRTQPQCDWLTEKIGYERLIELTCNPALPNFTLTKVLWVKEHEPEIFAKIRHIMCPKDYVRYRLTGEFAIDVQEASGTLLLDVTHRRWSREVAEAAGIPRAGCPRSTSRRRSARASARRRAGLTGLAAGTPVVAGAGDQGAGAVGMGICSRVRFRRPSGPREWCLPPRPRRPRIPRDGCTPSATRCRGCGT
jgi:xylulokinase